MQYFHITKDGEIRDWYYSLAEAHLAESRYDRTDCELIDEEEKIYRTVAWCKENDYDYEALLEENYREFIFEEQQNYAHPTDTGASVDYKKVYVTYEKREPDLEEAIKNTTA